MSGPVFRAACCWLVAGLLLVAPCPALAQAGAAPAPEKNSERALELRLRPVPENLPGPEQEALRKTLGELLHEQTQLEKDVAAYFATYGAEISPEAKEYPAYLETRASLIRRNDELVVRIRKYNAGTLAALDAWNARLQERIAGYRKNFERLGRAATQQSAAATDLGELGQQERDALLDTLRDRAKDAAFEAGELGVEKALERATRINAQAARKIIARLKKAGADNPRLFELIEAVGNAKNKQERLEKAKRLYEMLKNEVTLWKLGDMADREEYLAALIEVVSWLSPSPFLTVCAEGLFDAVKANLAAWLVLAPNQELLVNSAEAQLRDLKVLAEEQVELIRQRKLVIEERRLLPARNVEKLNIKL